ncbi:hypothetical protein CEXT_583021 [Caerostris extrusa]|uniref:Uncharacterized protein n=1 Tax=Caerostris extrusa TaxID=172846 RepID=A0AAV4TFD4_CAEEX|nr:hypothetical protein CEXT_583021 [Caerostris extrusa]
MISIPEPPPTPISSKPLFLPGRENPTVCNGDRTLESVVANSSPPPIILHSLNSVFSARISFSFRRLMCNCNRHRHRWIGGVLD